MELDEIGTSECFYYKIRKKKNNDLELLISCCRQSNDLKGKVIWLVVF